MRLYDSLTQKKREFVPRDRDHVTMYFCGPTVYNYIHLGNARPYVMSMVAKRYFESLGWRVTLAENITDIDDRIINKAQAEGRTAQEVAQEFAAAYIEDTDKLGLGRPDVEPYATEHIPEIIDLVQRLIQNGHAYVAANGDVYYDVASFRDYGKLSKQRIDEMRHGARITPGEDKADPLDFALWKAAKPGEPAWDSPWGPGRPGWHIECSAMGLKYLGEGFDIHGGGRDLIFPHHENEIAQSEGALRTDFVRFWVHNGMLNIKDEKMSKSVGNIFLLREALKQYPPEVLICFFVGSHYRSPIEFSAESLAEAGQQVERLRNVFRALADYTGSAADAVEPGAPETMRSAAAGSAPGDEGLMRGVEAARQGFAEAMADDLNTGGALGDVFTAAREINAALGRRDVSVETAAEARDVLTRMVYVLGLDAVARTGVEVPPDVLELATDRQRARGERNYAEADRLRDEIAARGYEVRDVPGGFKVMPRQG
ncbi:MAG: Cysteine--tRNA ligase [Actinobacteria bacterium ADurb.Bin444]|nr:MAG: Cysteine--tRNA ligase [Actinobacteria bacterium ADurb.Bin444]